jgi:hypothetical protein
MLKPQDVVVFCKLVSLEAPQVPIHRLAGDLNMSPSEVHHAIHRGVEAHLVEVVEHRNLAHEKRVNRAALLELCLTGLKYVFPVHPLSHARGMPTGWAAPMLQGTAAHPGVLPPVWPTEDGPVAGLAVPPLYRCVPDVARQDPTFYAMMAAVDALRTRCPRASRAAEVTLISLLGTPRAVPAPPRQAVLQ